MEVDNDAAGRLSRVAPPLASASPAMTSLPQPQPTPATAAKQRQMFTVELRPGETTVVSWKKLIKESGSGNGENPAPMANKPSLEAGPVAGVQPGGEDLKHTLQPPNCFSTVIEKIERLYMGKDSSDEEELVAPDDEQYDTEDSFIDDTELVANSRHIISGILLLQITAKLWTTVVYSFPLWNVVDSIQVLCFFA